eukprot:545064-Rhodomonas_salina.1
MYRDRRSVPSPSTPLSPFHDFAVAIRAKTSAMTGLMDGNIPQVAGIRTRRGTIDPTLYTEDILNHMQELESLFNQFRVEVGAPNDRPGVVYNPGAANSVFSPQQQDYNVNPYTF